ncbi:hypothetical protein LSCM1_08079 [Leishmania martiniquensis]|uniref:GPR1/FUN34/yaaH family n=1 Tax=Leishmania martiniquensis TaxID=1580590 RepID=A0A836KYK7_9TRYP|nr:hypothetical protein LSCM1_08079 [Leishmania martiniquensis]
MDSHSPSALAAGSHEPMGGNNHVTTAQTVALELRPVPCMVPDPGAAGPVQATAPRTRRHIRPRCKDCHAARQERLREKRRHLRELEEWAYAEATTPARRASTAIVGYYTFGFTLILLGLHYTGHVALDTVLVASSMCIGGGLQLITGLLSWAQGLTFAHVSFSMFGGFFLALSCTWMLPSVAVQAVSEYFMGAFYAVWGVVSCFLLLCTPVLSVSLLLQHITTASSLLCLAGGMMTAKGTAVRAGGYVAIVSGALSLYICFATLLNEVWEVNLLPLGETARTVDALAPWQRGSSGNSDTDFVLSGVKPAVTQGSITRESVGSMRSKQVDAPTLAAVASATTEEAESAAVPVVQNEVDAVALTGGNATVTPMLSPAHG